MAIYKVHLTRKCAGAHRWKILCEFSTDPDNPRVASEDFPSEEAILDRLHTQGLLLDIGSADLPEDERWVTINSAQLRSLGIAEIYSAPRFERIQ